MDRQKLWGRDPDWWNAVASLLQVAVLGVAVGLVNFFIGWHEKRVTLHEELAALDAQLADDAPQTYQAGLQGLLKTSAGRELVDNYIGGYINGLSLLCGRWEKAYFLVSRMEQAKPSPQEQTALVQLALSSWSCHSHSLVRDAQLQEVFKPACKVLNAKLPPLSVMRQAALLAILSSACPEAVQVSDLYKSIHDKFVDSGAGTPITLVTVPFTVFPDPEEGPVDPQAMGDIAFKIKQLFRDLGKNGLAVMWDQIATEPERERIVFGWQLLNDPELDFVLRKSAATKIQRWLDGAFGSEDRQTRYTAIAAVVKFHWAEYVPLLKSHAAHDPDPTVRRAAIDAIDSLQKTERAGIRHIVAASP